MKFIWGVRNVHYAPPGNTKALGPLVEARRGPVASAPVGNFRDAGQPRAKTAPPGNGPRRGQPRAKRRILYNVLLGGMKLGIKLGISVKSAPMGNFLREKHFAKPLLFTKIRRIYPKLSQNGK